MNLDKGYTLSTFANYFLCQGQQQAPRLGYSPLPINLVQKGFDQIKKIPGAVASSIDIKKCNNPTFSSSGANTLATTAPYPASCDQKGSSQCTTGTGGAQQNTVVSNTGGAKPGASAKPGATASGSPGTGGTGGGDTGNPGGTGANSGTGSGDGNGGSSAGDGSSNGNQLAVSDIQAKPVSIGTTLGDPGMDHTLETLAVLLLVGLAIGPPLVARLTKKESR
jgi:hypothetical protein